MSKIYCKETFIGVQYSQEDLTNNEYSNCLFKKCNFNDSNLSNSIFIDCQFYNCNLANVKVANCSFQEVLFKKCKLIGIRFTMIDPLLISWAFRECLIMICDFSDLDIKESRFVKCEIRETDYINTNLLGSSFSESDLKLCRFHNTILDKVDFVNSVNYNINPTNNRLKQAKFSYPEVLSLLDSFEIKVDY